MYDPGRSSNRRKSGSFWVILVIAIIAAAVAGYLSRSSGDESPVELQKENLPFGIAMTHDVSKNSSEYIQAEDTVSTQLSYVLSLAHDELSVTGENCFDSYTEEIGKLFDCISAMKDVHIASSSPLTEYEEYCSTYYSYVADYFAEIQKSESFTIEKYNTIVNWMKETTSPYEKLKEVFDSNGVTYTVKYRSNGTEYVEYEISDRGAN